MEEGHLLPDHVHVLLSIPPKYSVARIVGFIMSIGRARWVGVAPGMGYPAHWSSRAKDCELWDQ
jgi:REP element-mobilizing transposase RayT